jgi:CubicO group peptidase (beta-lactamase class C family)
MTLGFDWDELTIPYGDPRNVEDAMEDAPDRYRFILERPIMREPGTQWSYCGGATALLGRLIEKGTGEDLLTYCRRALFDPLGFGAVVWHKGGDSAYRAASGLRLLPRDLLMIGQLMLARGVWDGHEVVPTEWLKRVNTPVITMADGRRYGYQWYLGAIAAGSPPQPQDWVGDIGWGGQRLHVFPKLDLVVAQFCGNYDKPGMAQGRINNRVVADVVLPGFV